MTDERPYLGILLMFGFCALAPLGDSIAKLLGDRIGLGQLLLVRFGIQAGVLLPLALFLRPDVTLTCRLFGLTLLRTVLHILGIGLMFSALRYLPLADAIAIAFVMPFILLLLGHYVLGEEVGAPRKWACASGFFGTLLVIQPNFLEIGAPALLPLGVAVVFALFMLVTRQVARDIGAVALQAISGVQATAIVLPLTLLLPAASGGGMVWPDGQTLQLLIALGVIGTVAHLLMTGSLRFAPSATLAPMQYLEIPFGTLIGWLVFRDLPDGMAAFGIALTIGAGGYILARERRLSRRLSKFPAPPAA